MKTRFPLLFLLLFFTACTEAPTTSKLSTIQDNLYLQNRTPLHPKKYIELPLGAIRPDGWLLHQLELMRDGMTGHLDEWYPSVVGERNGWLGGDGDGWERGVYWLDGLVPLAWLLEDEDLKAKAMPWIEWTLNSQTESGYLALFPLRRPRRLNPDFKRPCGRTGGPRW